MAAARVCTHRHGSPWRYKPGSCHKPCRCTPCRVAKTSYDRDRRAAAEAGRPYRMDSAPVVAHIAALRVTMSAERIAEVAGVSVNTVRRLARGENPTSVRAIGEAILGVHSAPGESSAQEIRCLVDAGPAREALRQILTAGHTQAMLARFTGRDPSTFSRLLHGKPMLHAEVAEVILDARDRLLVRGKREGAPTVVDERIVAQLCEGTPTARRSTPAERAEAIRLLHGRGLYDREIGAVIGMSGRNVLRIRRDKLHLPAHPGSRRDRDALEAIASAA